MVRHLGAGGDGTAAGARLSQRGLAVLLAVPALLAAAPSGLGWELRGPEGKGTGRAVDGPAPEALYGTGDALGGGGAPRVLTDPAALAAVAADTLAYLRAMAGSDPAVGPGLFGGVVPEARMEATLELVVRTADEHPERLTDAAWLASAFEVYRWARDPTDTRATRWQLGADEVRVTRYLTTQADGTAAPDAVHTQALYADPGEPWRTRYTRGAIMAGAYVTGPDAGRASPLAWLTEAAVHDAIMQGSTVVSFPDGSQRTFGVDVSNGVPYVPAHSGRAQDRYWYFKERPGGPRGWGPPGSPDIGLRAGVAVAGDVYNLGLGRLLALSYLDAQSGVQTLRLAILADSGGAFQPNLCQLDWYGGAFPSHAALYAAWSSLPDHVRAGVLVAQ